MEHLRILVAESDSFTRKNLREILIQAGYSIVAEAKDGMSALKLVRSLEPEMVIAAVNLPVLSGLELAEIIDENKLCAVILTAEYADKDQVFKASEKFSIPVFFKPFDDFQLFSVLEYAHTAYTKLVELEKEVHRLQNDLETRKIVERAKGILMRTQGLSEEAAFKKMQQQSMKRRTSMKNIAEAIVTAYDI